MKEIVAAPNKILTSKSSNYSLIFSQIDSFSFFASSFKPYFSTHFSASVVVNPFLGSAANSLITSDASFL